jgi:flagellar biosynthetic protein FlhB
MAEERFEERTEPATPRRRQEARERGHVARSADLSAALVLLGALLALEFFGRGLAGSLFESAAGILGRLAEVDGDPENLVLHYGGAVAAVLSGMAPFFILVIVAALAANFLQVGFLLTGQPLAPDLDRLDPVQGIRRLFSARAFVRLASGLLKLAVVGGVLFATIWSERERLTGLAGLEFEPMLGYATGMMLTLALRAVLALLALALLDYGYQRWQYERDLRMSRAEVREEMKRYEGDPKIRERRRALQRRLALQRMIQRVPKATVVITNPTHVAVAVEYDREKMEAPVVSAKGAEHLAERIREAAHEHGVPVVERPELARALYKAVEVGQSIPMELYQAVAEVLAYVYRLKNTVAVG